MRTEMTLETICHHLTHNCGDELAAARAAGVSLVFMNQWAKDDKRVAERFQEAVRVGSQGLVSAAIQRGVHGVQEDVYYKGDVVGQRTVYSDGLLTTLLKAKVPEFATGGDGAPQVTVNVANIMPRATTYEDWLAMKNSTLKAIAHTPADAEPVIEGEYTDATARLPDLL